MTDTLTIELREEAGAFVSNRTRAATLRERIASHVDATAGASIIDFANVENVSESFADELVAVLVAERGAEWFRRHVKIKNLSGDARLSILQAVNHREHSPA